MLKHTNQILSHNFKRLDTEIQTAKSKQRLVLVESDCFFIEKKLKDSTTDNGGLKNENASLMLKCNYWKKDHDKLMIEYTSLKSLYVNHAKVDKISVKSSYSTLSCSILLHFLVSNIKVSDLGRKSMLIF